MTPPFCTTLIASIIPSRRLPLESVHDFSVSAAEEARVSNLPSVRPVCCEVPSLCSVAASSFSAVSLASDSLFFWVKLMMAKTSAPTKSTAATMKRTSQVPPAPLFFGGAAAGLAALGGGPGGGPGGGADGGPGGGADGGPGGGAGGVVLIGCAPSWCIPCQA